jgi:uncharacterized protein (TIGR02145 family)
MKNLIIAMIVISCTLAQGQITHTIVHETGGNTDAYQLSFMDSIVHDSLNSNMIIHKVGGTTVSYLITNIDSVTYGIPAMATCGLITDSRDNETYTTVQIGNQCWMAENLRYIAPGSWLNSANPTVTYGRIYDWATVMNGATSSSSNPSGVQGICPGGWHLPSDAEWNELEMALGMSAADTANGGYRGTHGTGMSSTTGWNFGNGTNTSGFNAFPAGYYYSGGFGNLGDYATFWSSTEYSSTYTWYRDLTGGGGVNRSNFNKTFGLSCRCAKD